MHGLGSTPDPLFSLGFMDWNLIKTFVAVAEHGSLSRAATALGISQPTAGRHIQSLVQQFGAELFVRHARGVRLTDKGAALYELARQVRHSVARLEMGAQELDDALPGTVRISAARVVADYVLPAALVALRHLHPQIDLEIVAQDEVANLLYRDVDVAIRMTKPLSDSLFGRQVASASIGLYATREYLEAHPSPLEDYRGHTFLGYDTLAHGVDALRDVGIQVTREDFAVRSDAQTFHIQAILSGLGIGAMQDAIAAQHNRLVPLDLGLEIEPLPVWLLIHESLRQSGRVRAVMTSLGHSLERFYSTP